MERGTAHGRTLNIVTVECKTTSKVDVDLGAARGWEKDEDLPRLLVIWQMEKRAGPEGSRTPIWAKIRSVHVFVITAAIRNAIFPPPAGRRREDGRRGHIITLPASTGRYQLHNFFRLYAIRGATNYPPWLATMVIQTLNEQFVGSEMRIDAFTDPNDPEVQSADAYGTWHGEKRPANHRLVTFALRTSPMLLQFAEQPSYETIRVVVSRNYPVGFAMEWILARTFGMFEKTRNGTSAIDFRVNQAKLREIKRRLDSDRRRSRRADILAGRFLEETPRHQEEEGESAASGRARARGTDVESEALRNLLRLLGELTVSGGTRGSSQ